MNYLKLYCKIVRNEETKGLTKKQAKEQGLYVEGHHIFPRCIYGQHKDGNKRVIYVTPRVHYILHALLVKGFIKRYGKSHMKTNQMLLAHLYMKGYENNERYINSILYETLKEKYIENIKGVEKPIGFGEKVSRGKGGKNTKRESHNTKAIKIYFKDGKIITHLDGIKDFSILYGYSYNCISEMLNNKRKKYRDIVKIEHLIVEKKIIPKKYKPILKGIDSPHTIPVVLYFSDGRTKIYLDGIYNFCKENPEYSGPKLSSLKSKKIKRHKDIIKVEEYYPNINIIPITKINKTNSIKVTFSNGVSIIEENGFSTFCRNYPEYNRKTLSKISKTGKSSYPEIIKVERLTD